MRRADRRVFINNTHFQHDGEKNATQSTPLLLASHPQRMAGQYNNVNAKPHPHKILFPMETHNLNFRSQRSSFYSFGLLKNFFQFHSKSTRDFVKEKKDIPLDYDYTYISNSRGNSLVVQMTSSSLESASVPHCGIDDLSSKTTQAISNSFQTSSNQKKFLKSIRMYAIGLCVFAFSSAVIGCIIGKPSYIEEHTSYQSDAITNRYNKSINESGHRKSVTNRRDIGHDHKKRSNGTMNTKGEVTKVQHQDKTMLLKLRNEFHEWITHHGRDYGSDEEKEKRFQIWKENHFRTMEKNERHGPCKMTGKAVFGSNHFKDLTPEEFRSKYLTGYTGPKMDEMSDHKKRKLRTSNNFIQEYPAHPKQLKQTEILSSDGLHDPSILSHKLSRHPSVQERYLKHIQETPKLSKTYYNKEEKSAEKACKCKYYHEGTYHSNNNNNNNTSYYYYNYGSRRRLSLFKNKWPLFKKTYYDRSEKSRICGSSYGKSYYNSNSKNGNNNVDCRKYRLEADSDYNEVSNQRYSSTSCDWYDMTCWLQKVFDPIYSVASSESRYSNYNYPSSIDWRKLGAITSVHSQGSCGACWAITATETIEAVNFIATGVLRDLAETEIIICEDSCQMCNGGWPQNAYDYVQENKGLPAETTTSYDGNFLMTLTTVTTGESDELSENEVEYIKQTTCPAQQGSGDNSESTSERYGAIKGYAYATDRCICYTDGSGCDCDKQNEELAVMNVASYGPATVCLEASTWQDYTGGIITADSGCTKAFLDMNHCVQVVGYAYTDVSDDEDEEEEDTKEGSKDNGSHDKGEKQSHREGYWIVRNQWSSYWGMNGYAYVAMGDNTCGILNDMTQVFMNDQ